MLGHSLIKILIRILFLNQPKIIRRYIIRHNEWVIIHFIRKQTECLRIFILSKNYKFLGSETCSTRCNCSTVLVTLTHTSYAHQRSVVGEESLQAVLRVQLCPVNDKSTIAAFSSLSKQQPWTGIKLSRLWSKAGGIISMIRYVTSRILY